MLTPSDYLAIPSKRSDPGRGVFDPSLDHFLPDEAELEGLLGLNAGPSICNVLRSALLCPIEELTWNHGKRVRGQLVTLGYRLVVDADELRGHMLELCRICSEVVELIHAGSLIVDDIEDGSRTRRGRPALHIRYGMALALNAGNWLYFWPFQLLKQLRLPTDKLIYAYEHYHRTLLRAHFGQALDLGTRIDGIPRCHIEELCLASMRLKTGALMGFALSLGGLAAGAPRPILSIFDEFGADLGVVLQMFDDLGNMTGKCAPEKKYEDLLLHRPSWVWAWAARTTGKQAYGQLVAAVKKLPDAKELEAWAERHELINLGRQSARRHLDLAFHKLRRRLDAHSVPWSRTVFDELKALGDGIAVAYE